MTTDLFLSGLAILSLAAIIIVALTTDRSESRSFDDLREDLGSRNNRSGR